ncbi:MAG TPA: hypothetical protein VE861_07415, partial [Gemmatimonadaceae bacterium]|nr:hypothetical protein [Gemmatimonadaceae bacterium]
SPGAQNVRMQPVRMTDADPVHWGFAWTAPHAELLALARGSCEVAAWMQFARAPFWRRFAGDSVIIGDMRYDRDRSADVALFRLGTTPRRCPAAAPWIPPRSDVWPAAAALRGD